MDIIINIERFKILSVDLNSVYPDNKTFKII